MLTAFEERSTRNRIWRLEQRARRGAPALAGGRGGNQEGSREGKGKADRCPVNESAAKRKEELLERWRRAKGVS